MNEYRSMMMTSLGRWQTFWIDMKPKLGLIPKGYRNRDFEIDILTSHLVSYDMPKILKFNLLLINLIKKLNYPLKVHVHTDINWSYGRFHVSWDSEMCEFWRGNWPLDREGFSFPIFSGYLVSSVWLWQFSFVHWIYPGIRFVDSKIGPKLRITTTKIDLTNFC